jgi:hypothetical protein
MITELLGRPAYTPPKSLSYARPPSTLDIGDAFSVYANPDLQSTRVVTLIAPPFISPRIRTALRSPCRWVWLTWRLSWKKPITG